MNGVTAMANHRSLPSSMLRVDMMAGMAHAVPLIMGTTDLPLRPNGRMNRSIMKTTRDMYPDSSNKAMNPNNMAICGTNINTPVMPGIKPWVIMCVKNPPGSLALID